MKHESLTFSKDGLRAYYKMVDDEGYSKIMTLTWNDESKVPPYDKLLRMFRNSALQTSNNNRTTVSRIIKLPFQHKAHFMFLKCPDADEACVIVGKKKISAPIKNGKILFKKFAVGKEDHFTIGAGAKKAVCVKFS